MENKNTLSYMDETKIHGIFTTKKWPIDTKNKHSLFNRYRNRCRILNEEERALFYKLTIEYRWVLLDEYIQLLSELLTKVVDNYTKSAQHIYIYPIKKESDQDEVKSADVISYLSKAIQMKHIDKLNNKTFRVVTTIPKLAKKHKLSNKPFLILDDFIGSGKYALDVAEELVNSGIPKTNIIVCSLFISENGEHSLKKEGYNVEYVEKVNSIIKRLTPKEVEILCEIENKLNVDSDFSFGFNKSANLISLIRTPNNTLPVFWYKGTFNTSSAPFERSK